MLKIPRKKMRILSILLLVLIALAVVRCVNVEPAGYQGNIYFASSGDRSRDVRNASAY